MMENNYNKLQLWGLVVLRWLVGWHFLYEGVVKLLNPNWSAKGYLMGSDSLFGLFNAMGSSEFLVGVIDFLNVWLLIFTGLFLILGMFNKLASLAGIFLLGMFYLAYPPIFGLGGSMPTEGSYILVNKNLIELFVLVVIMAFPTTQYVGLDRVLKKNKN